MSKIEWLQQEINGLKESGLYNNIRTLSSPQGAWLVVDGKKVLNFCSNNYLGLANHPKIAAAAKAAIDNRPPAALIPSSVISESARDERQLSSDPSV